MKIQSTLWSLSAKQSAASVTTKTRKDSSSVLMSWIKNCWGGTCTYSRGTILTRPNLGQRREIREGGGSPFIEMHHKCLGERHPNTCVSRYPFTGTLFLAGRYEEAEELMADVAVIRRQLSGVIHSYTRRVRRTSEEVKERSPISRSKMLFSRTKNRRRPRSTLLPTTMKEKSNTAPLQPGLQPMGALTTFETLLSFFLGSFLPVALTRSHLHRTQRDDQLRGRRLNDPSTCSVWLSARFCSLYLLCALRLCSVAC